MIEAIKTNLIMPMATRVGTATSFWLVGLGVAQHEANILGSALTVAIGVGIDLMLAWYRKRAIVRKAVGGVPHGEQ